MLCLRKPVVFVGDEWADDNLWTNQLEVTKLHPGERLTEGAMETWAASARKKFREDKDFPAIDALIERDVIAEHLTDAHERLAVLGIDDWRQAIDKLLELPESSDHAVVASLWTQLVSDVDDRASI